MFSEERTFDCANFTTYSPEEKNKNKIQIRPILHLMKMHTEMTVQQLTARGVASLNAGHVSLPFALEFR